MTKTNKPVPAAAVHTRGAKGRRIRQAGDIVTVDPDEFVAERRTTRLIRAAGRRAHRGASGLYVVTDPDVNEADSGMEPLGYRAAEDEDDASIGTIFGYGAVFNTWTRIWSWWEGEFDERIKPGAFKRTIEERGDSIKSLFNHGMDFAVGDRPIGKPSELKERSRGLWDEIPLDDTSYNRDLAASVRSGAIDGQSFMFDVVRDEWEFPDDETPQRTLKEVRLYEIGPVTWPAYEATTLGIRSAEGLRSWLASREHGGIMPENHPADAGEHSPPRPAPRSTPPESRHLTAARMRRMDARIETLRRLTTKDE